MIDRYYRDLELYRYSSGGFSNNSGYELFKNFKGIIQVGGDSKAFSSGKSSQNVDAKLFCSVEESFETNDKVRDPLSGQTYFLSGYNSQPIGITGINSKRGQHAEYSLTYDKKGVN